MATYDVDGVNGRLEVIRSAELYELEVPVTRARD